MKKSIVKMMAEAAKAAEAQKAADAAAPAAQPVSEPQPAAHSSPAAAPAAEGHGWWPLSSAPWAAPCRS